MPDPGRPQRRHPNRLNREHAGQSLDPTLTRKGLLAHPGSLMTGFAAILFFCYVFNVGGLQIWLDHMFGGLDSSAKSHNSEVATVFMEALPYLGVALAAVVVFLVLLALTRGARTMSKKRKLSGRERVSLNEFVDAAAQHHVSKKVAREAYHSLLPHYLHDPRIKLSDQLGGHLHMNAIEISDLFGSLLKNTDRMRRVGEDMTKMLTVLDLLTAVENSTVRSLTQSKLYLRRGQGVDGDVSARKRPSVGNRLKETVMRTMMRKAYVPAEADAAPKREHRSFVRPFRPAVKESELAAKTAAAQTGQTQAGK